MVDDGSHDQTTRVSSNNAWLRTMQRYVLGFQCPLLVDEINISTVYVWYSIVFYFGIPVSIVG